MFAGLVLLVLAAGPVGSTHFETEHTLVLYVGAALTLALGLVARRFTGEAQRGRARRAGRDRLRRLADRHPRARRPAPGRGDDPARAHDRPLRPARLLAVLDRACSARSVTAATAPLILLETVVPAVVGIAVFGDQVRAGWWPVAVVGFALSTLGALVLCGAETRLEHVEQPGLEPATEPITP